MRSLLQRSRPVTARTLPSHARHMQAARVHMAASLCSSTHESAATGADAAPGVLVLGGGIMGVSVAWQLLRGGYGRVALLSESFSPDTTSDTAGASVVPYTDSQCPVEQARLLKWTQQTSDFLADLRLREGTQRTGISLSASYDFYAPTNSAASADASSNTSAASSATATAAAVPQPPWWASSMQGFRLMSPAERVWVLGAASEPFESAWSYTTLTVHTSTYLAFLSEHIRKLGGTVHRAKIESIPRLRAAMAMYARAHALPTPQQREEAINKLDSTRHAAASSSSSSSAVASSSSSPSACIPPLPAAVHSLLRSGSYSLLVNCSGLGSKWLVPDLGVVGCKGVVLRVAGCPGAMNHCYSAENPTAYIIPRLKDAIVGGTYGVADYDLQVKPGENERILKNAAKFVPDIERAPSVDVLSGLRPWRSTVRLEAVTGPCEAAQPLPEAQLVPEPAQPDFYSLLDERAVRTLQREEQDRKANRNPREVAWDEQAEKVPVIHNYGHGGSGITLHMGCAAEVLRLAQELCPLTAAVATRSKL